MKKYLMLAVLAATLGGLSGCKVAECWRYAWNSRFHPERNVIVTDPCMVVDPCCDPCGDPCGDSCGMSGCGAACGAPATMPQPSLP